MSVSGNQPTVPLAGQDGMTLIEILIALVIIGIGLVAVAAVIPLSSYGIQEGNQMSTAIFLAEQRLEQVRGLQWTGPPTPTTVDCLGTSANLALGYPDSSGAWAAAGSAPSGFASCTSPPNLADQTPASNSLAPPYRNYARQIRIQDCASNACFAGSDNTLRLVTVRVSYVPLQGVGGGGSGSTTPPHFVDLKLLVTRR